MHRLMAVPFCRKVLACCILIPCLLLTGSIAVRAQQSAPQARPGAKQTAPAAPRATAPSENGDAALRQRVEQLEEQLVDMQVTVGTLESLARGGGAAPAARAVQPGGDGPRVDALEQQVRQLSQQVEQLSAQVRTLGGRPVTAAAPREAGEQPSPPLRPGRTGPAVLGQGGFGSTTITTDTAAADPIGRVLQGSGPRNPPPASAVLPPSDSSPKQLYEAAYGYLLQQDYASAEAGFDEFLKRHPTDPLAGNAQYWLGESFFVRGQYKAAAGAFLKGYQNHARSAKAPDSLLKLAMSLDRLGQKDAACSSYSELNQKFPQAPNYVKTRAENERRRLGCV
jgi:tol-pal system protein YbgF